MCIIEGKISEQQVTGYKIALKEGNKFCSPITGIEYKPGNVEIPTHYKEHNIKNDLYIHNVLKPGDFAYNPIRYR